MKKENSPLIVSIACPNEDSANRIAKALVEHKLIACAQLFPIQSIYRWEGTVQLASEVLLQAKTMSDQLPEVEALVTQLHEYEVPELIATSIEWGLAAYLDWMWEVTGERR